MKKIVLKSAGSTQWMVCVLVLITICLTSCASRNIQRNVTGIQSNFKAAILNEPYEAKNWDVSTVNRYNLLHMFNIYDMKADTVKIQFKNKNELFVTYTEDIMGLKKTNSATFKGKFKKGGVFEVFLEKKRLQIPPVLPVLYSSIHIDKIYLSITEEGNLLLENDYKRSGNILILAAGSRFKSSQIFQIID